MREPCESTNDADREKASRGATEGHGEGIGRWKFLWWTRGLFFEDRLPANRANNARAILLSESVADIQVERQSEPWKIFQGECQDHGNLVFAGAVVSQVQAKCGNPAAQVSMNGICLSIEESGFKLVVFVNAESPIVIESHVSVKREFAGILEKGIALQILMSQANFDIRGDCPVSSGGDRPETFVQKRNLRVNGKVSPWHRLKPNPVENVGE
jgi:hypothetical protein